MRAACFEERRTAGISDIGMPACDDIGWALAHRERLMRV